MRKAEVYCLMDPRNNRVIYYVGGTIQGLKRRLQQHIWASKSKTSRVGAWIKSLLNQGIKPVIELLCVCDTPDYTVEETAWIDFCWANGHPLTNVRDGGQLGFNLKHSRISRDRMSKSSKGQKAWNKGVKQTPEQKEANRQAQLGKKHSQEHKEAIRLGCLGKNKGKKCSEAQKQALRDFNLGKILSDETRARMSLGKLGNTNAKGNIPWNKGVPLPQEAKDHLSLMLKGKSKKE